jgi:ABC-type sugar transport system ATPase subunit
MNLLPGTITAQSGADVTVTLSGGETLPARLADPPPVGTRVTLGVRPEALAPVTDGTGMFRGEVQLTEQMGGESFVYVTLPGGQSVTLEIKGQPQIVAGARMDIAVQAGRMHLFGPDDRVLRQL